MTFVLGFAQGQATKVSCGLVFMDHSYTMKTAKFYTLQNFLCVRYSEFKRFGKSSVLGYVEVAQ